MWRLCDNICDVINTCDGTIHNLSAYVCDWSLGAHKIMCPILSLKLGVTHLIMRAEKLETLIQMFTRNIDSNQEKNSPYSVTPRVFKY